MRSGHPKAVSICDNLTLLDPAVGSGAFLLGALERLAAFEPDGGRRSARKRRILTRNLFGVDQNATAVRLAELRLWLAVIAADPAERMETVKPLPNLDCLIRQGDSLFDHSGGPPVGPRTIRNSGASSPAFAVRRSTQSVRAKYALMRKLRATESLALTDSLSIAEERHRTQIAECLGHARASDLFGHIRGLD